MRRVFFLLLLVVSTSFGTGFDLKLNRLTGSLTNLQAAERATLDRAVTLIKKGQHTAAFAQVSELARNNANNSAVRVVLAFALLQAGNLAGAFDHAQEAEAAPDHNSYVCLFLARVAFLVGDQEVCRRELQHVKRSGEHRSEVNKLEKELRAASQ